MVEDMMLPDGWLARVEPEPNSGCWLWIGAANNGYGATWDRATKKNKVVTRFLWEMYRGPIPAGMLVCHRCDMPACINLDHLFLGTVRDNALDMMAKGRGKYANIDEARAIAATRKRKKTHCARGHEFTPENTAEAKRKGMTSVRRCRICERARRRVWDTGRRRERANYERKGYPND